MWKAKNKNKAKHRHRLALTCLLDRISLELSLLAILVLLWPLSHLAIKLTCRCEKLPPPFLLSLSPASPPVCNSLLVLVCLIHFVLYFQQRLEISFLLSLKVLNSSIFLPLLILLLYFYTLIHSRIWLSQGTLEQSKRSVATFQNSQEKCFVKRRKFKA